MKRDRYRGDNGGERNRWSGGILSGMLGIGIVVVARVAGVFQPLEWAALDARLRWRSPEPTDERVVIISIDEADIQAVGTYPIPDGVLAQLLRQLQAYNPQVIGLDIVRDLPVEPGHEDLVTAFQTMDHVIGPATVVPDRFGMVIAPPPALPPEQIGFVDNILDADGNVRRSLLGASDPEGDFQFSMPLRLAIAYLEPYDIELANGIRDPWAMRFGSVELPRVYPNSGGYVRADAGGTQTLLNFRSGPSPFRIVSLTDVLEGNANPEWFRDRIVLIGVMASSAKDIVQSSAVTSSNPGLVYGVEVQAHATSQIVNAVLEGRSLLQTWPDGWEYGWIILWGLAGIGVSRLIQRPSRYFLLVIGTSIGLIGLGHVSLIGGWWLPIAPALAAFLLNGVVFHIFYLYNRSLQSRIRDRQLVIEQTFTAIHNGPLQTLATLMRNADDPAFSTEHWRQNLQQLNQELRSVYETIRAEVDQDNQIYLRGQSSLDLTLPLHELLYQVYTDTLQRDFPHFPGIKVKIVKFEPFDETALSSHQKRGLCRFLEEALCNVGKHAVGVTRLVVECWHDGDGNRIQVADNGRGGKNTELEAIAQTKHASPPISTTATGRGTQQARILAKELGGTFERSPNSPQGTVCELRWQPDRSLLQRLKQQIQTKVVSVFGEFNG